MPRPETETVVEAALAALASEASGQPGRSLIVRAPDTSSARAAPASEASGQRGDRHALRSRTLRMADLGTGSGALLLALAVRAAGSLRHRHRRQRRRSRLRPRQCRRHSAWRPRAAFVACDYGAALGGRFDLVVCNPPYVARSEIATLAPEVREFDPRRALDGGIDGLDAYRAIAADARRLLAPDGTLVLELGAGMADRGDRAPRRRRTGPRRPAAARSRGRRRGPWWRGLCHETITFQMRKKALGLWGKTD